MVKNFIKIWTKHIFFRTKCLVPSHDEFHVTDFILFTYFANLRYSCLQLNRGLSKQQSACSKAFLCLLSVIDVCD